MTTPAIWNLGKEHNIKKNEHLLREGQRAEQLYFVKSGLIRVYYLRESKEITDWFGTPGTYLTSIAGFYRNTSSEHYIQALEDSIVQVIPRHMIERECLTHSDIEKAYRDIIIQHLLRLQERITALQFYTAKERYELLLEKNPVVVVKAPRTHIASYLGISLETLSRVSGQGM